MTLRLCSFSSVSLNLLMNLLPAMTAHSMIFLMHMLLSRNQPSLSELTVSGCLRNFIQPSKTAEDSRGSSNVLVPMYWSPCPNFVMKQPKIIKSSSLEPRRPTIMISSKMLLTKAQCLPLLTNFCTRI